MTKMTGKQFWTFMLDISLSVLYWDVIEHISSIKILTAKNVKALILIIGLIFSRLMALGYKNGWCIFRPKQIRYPPLLSYAKSAILHIRHKSTWFYSC